VVAVGERLAPGRDDMRRRREIGLADAEIDDRLALRAANCTIYLTPPRPSAALKSAAS